MAHSNRISQFDHLWTGRDGEIQSQPPFPCAEIPKGFVAMNLSQFDAENQAFIQSQAKLYQWAYNEARRKADENFFFDWVI